MKFKKFLTLFSLIPVSFSPLTVISCEPIQTFPSISSRITTDGLEKLFSGDNKITPVNFKYLEYINGYWEHNGFESSLDTYKVNNHIVNIYGETEEEIAEKIFFTSLAQIFDTSLVNNEYDFTGLTFVIENIFVDSLTFNYQQKILETNTQTTLAVTVNKGWETKGKMLLEVKTSEPYSEIDAYAFICKWMESTLYNFKVLEYNEKEAIYFINDDFSFENEELITTLIQKSKSLNGLVVKKSDIELNKDYFIFLNKKFMHIKDKDTNLETKKI